MWARYISKWVSSYKVRSYGMSHAPLWKGILPQHSPAEAYGIPIWAVTVQNEPENNATWEACYQTAMLEGPYEGVCHEYVSGLERPPNMCSGLLTAEEEAAFVGQHLGPPLSETNITRLKSSSFPLAQLKPQSNHHMFPPAVSVQCPRPSLAGGSSRLSATLKK